MERLVVGILILLCVNNAYATAQAPDKLIYKGKTYYLYTNPLESYFNRDNPRPKFDFKVTSNWRGYIATWAIENGVLYLADIERATINNKTVKLSDLFPDRQSPIKATWYTGILRIPQGQRLIYVHMGYGSVYERDLILTVKNGKVTKEEIIDNTKKKISSRHELGTQELEKLKRWVEGIKG